MATAPSSELRYSHFCPQLYIGPFHLFHFHLFHLSHFHLSHFYLSNFNSFLFNLSTSSSLLAKLRLTSISPLQPFLSHLSLASMRLLL
jgi:hypothetical protein